MGEKKSFFTGLSLKATDAQVQRQIEYYNTLKPWQSFRGISALLILFSIILMGVLSYFQIMPIKEVWIDLVLMAVLGVFVYRGSKIAILLAGIYLTLSKIIMIAQAPNNLVMQLLWWYIFASYFYKAWQVEKVRSAIKPAQS